MSIAETSVAPQKSDRTVPFGHLGVQATGRMAVDAEPEELAVTFSVGAMEPSCTSLAGNGQATEGGGRGDVDAERVQSE